MAIVQDELIFTIGDQEYRPVMIWDDDDDEPRPVVLVCGTILGRNDFAVDRAKAIQKLGYVGVALDLYGDGLASDDHEEGRIHMTALLQDREELRQRLAASIDFVATQPNVDSMKMAAIGYCFGGLCALDIARTRDDVLAAASFHGLLTAPPRSLDSPINTKVLVFHGNEDPLVPPEQVAELREELTARHADWQIHVYGSTYHSFTVPTSNAPDLGLMYNAHAEQRSWAALTDFLHETF